MLVTVFKLFDAGLMICAFVASVLVSLRHGGMAVNEFFSMRITIQTFAIFSLFVIVWHLIFGFLGLYTSYRLSSRRGEVIDVVKATSTGTFVVLLGAIAFHIPLITVLFLGVFWVISTAMTVSSRLSLRVVLACVRRYGRNLRHIVIVGTNARALEFAHQIASRPNLGYRISGFVDHDWRGTEEFRRSGYAIVSDFSSFPQFLRNNVVDEIALALPFRSMHEQASRIVALCEEQGITVRVFANLFNLKRVRSCAEAMEDDDAVITHSRSWMEGGPILAKRILDFSVSGVAVALLSPLLLAVAILIKVTSPGPVLFVQKRLGLNKRHFNVYKFRTMVADAEKRIVEIEHLNEVSGPVFKIKNDPRITPLGRFLRKTSIDELPQLLNVLIGNMSLVGPRPLPVRDYQGFNADWQCRRFSVKPGITCLWQVQGRSSIPFETWMELDLQYIDKWSLWLDFQILLRTVPAVLKGLGAA